MSRLIYGFSLIFSLILVTPHLHRRQGTPTLALVKGRQVDEEDDHELIQKKQLKPRRVAPPSFKNPPTRLRSRCNYFSTRSRDARDLNQRSIRRKFINS